MKNSLIDNISILESDLEVFLIDTYQFRNSRDDIEIIRRLDRLFNVHQFSTVEQMILLVIHLQFLLGGEAFRGKYHHLG